MKISVLIPTYNSAATIEATLESVLQQTVQPFEILVQDDGSTDRTVALVNSYKPRVTVFQEGHKGVAGARNALCKRAQGDFIAFLDSDDIWHPRYLEVQSRLFMDHPNAAASFTGHVNFYGYGSFQWDSTSLDSGSNVEFLTPLKFFKRYNHATGPFGMDYCCIPKWVVRKIGREPFSTELSGAVDSYFFCRVALCGPVVYTSTPLAAYRIIEESLSANRLMTFGAWVHAFELLEDDYKKSLDANLYRAFRMAFASKRRQYAKILMGAGKTAEAQRQLWNSLRESSSPVSATKSLALLLLTHMPASLQPTWPPSYRDSRRIPYYKQNEDTMATVNRTVKM